jgi:hypothetical protein
MRQVPVQTPGSQSPQPLKMAENPGLSFSTGVHWVVLSRYRRWSFNLTRQLALRCGKSCWKRLLRSRRFQRSWLWFSSDVITSARRPCSSAVGSEGADLPISCYHPRLFTWRQFVSFWRMFGTYVWWQIGCRSSEVWVYSLPHVSHFAFYFPSIGVKCNQIELRLLRNADMMTIDRDENWLLKFF